MIMADQLPARYVRAYGHPLIKTPNMDALAERGVLFQSAYSNCPICAPSRASMCAGQLVSSLGSFDNGADFPASVPTFMHQLRLAGYEVILSGKMHFLGPDQLHGFERRVTPEIYPASFTWTADWTRGAHHNPGTAVDQLRDAGLCDWNLQLDYDEETGFRALEALRDCARREDEGRPFFLCASFTHPHDPFITTQRWWDLYDHDLIEMPAVPAMPIDDMHPYNRWLQIHHMIDVYPPQEEHVRNARHAFYGMVSYFDHKVGQLVDELQRLGLDNNTVILVTADHGEMMGEHGMWFKRTFFEPSVGVPLIFAGTEHIQCGQRIEDEVSLVDLFPTLVELSGREDWPNVESHVDGQSLCGLLRGESRERIDGALSEYYSEGVCQPMRMAVSDRLKYVYVHEEEPLLFDLLRDPHETNNCIADAAYAQRLEPLKLQVHDGWDPVEMRQRVLKSQQRRLLIHESLAHGRSESWDVQPHIDPTEQYVRHQNAQATNIKRRFPRTD